MYRLIPLPVAFLIVAFQLAAQPPAERPAKDFGESSLVTRMMEFNKKKDGKLTKEEVTDPRLHRLFDLADANKDGVVTREELMALAAKLDAENPPGGPDGKGPGKGPGGKGKGEKGPGGKGDKGFGGTKGKGPGGPGGFGGPPQPGRLLAPFLQDQLKLTDEQRTQLRSLQKQIDAKLDDILTDQQKQQLKESRDRGPGGLGPPK